MLELGPAPFHLHLLPKNLSTWGLHWETAICRAPDTVKMVPTLGDKRPKTLQGAQMLPKNFVQLQLPMFPTAGWVQYLVLTIHDAI